MTVKALLDRLWIDYQAQNPQVSRIHALLEARGERIVNDHIALRTFDDPRVGLEVLARPFLRFGYEAKGEYEFREKKLFAKHFEHPDESLPKVFISELELRAVSEDARATIATLLEALPQDIAERDDLPALGRPWQLDVATYERLSAESEYAGWLAAFGFCANHFTVLANALTSFASLEALNAFLIREGFELNSAGGLVKGTPADLLEQSSTLASRVRVEFSDGTREIPGCYYEFARRYPDATGRLFSAFLAPNADKIFESTDRR
jgi:hypothetical protein